MKYKKDLSAEIYLDKASYWRWRIIDPNGRVLARSAHSYCNEKDCEEILLAIVSLKPIVPKKIKNP